MIDPDNEDDVLEYSCVDSQEVESQTHDRLDQLQKAAPAAVAPNTAFKPFWVDRYSK